MKKGDLKKQEILRTAESLFCRYGYEATSIQDVLDELKTSKGSFYHHFVSKEALLEEICRIRAKGSRSVIGETIPSGASPLDRLNMLFDEMIPLTGEKLSFLLMILPVFLSSEGASLRTFYRKELSDLYRLPVSSVLSDGTKEGFFSCPDDVLFADISLQLVNSLWLNVCDMIVRDAETGSRSEASELMAVISQYRLALERMLSAPFGSIELIRLPELKVLTEQIHQHWK